MYKEEGRVQETTRDSETVDLKKWGQGAATRNQTQKGWLHKTYLHRGMQPDHSDPQEGSQENTHATLLSFFPPISCIPHGPGRSQRGKKSSDTIHTGQSLRILNRVEKREWIWRGQGKLSSTQLDQSAQSNFCHKQPQNITG